MPPRYEMSLSLLEMLDWAQENIEGFKKKGKG